jgi:VIT1/CCC1 family predicted Fe2+/Mn2+ transporter
MMLEELGLTDFDGSPIINGIVNFSCFVVFGFLPVLPYCINKATHSKSSHILISSLVIGGFFLFFLGLLKAWFIGTNPIKSGLVTLILGSAAVGIGYGIGVAIQ